MIINSTGKPLISKDMKVAKRVYRQLSDESMGSLWEAIIEFITNVDDSYERLSQLKRRKMVWKSFIWILPGGKKFNCFSYKRSSRGMFMKHLKNVLEIMVKNKVELPQEGLLARSKRCCVYWKCIWVSVKDGYFTDKNRSFNKKISGI